MHVQQIGQVVVKATQFINPTQVEITQHGIRNDRLFALVEATDKFVGSSEHSEFIPLKFSMAYGSSDLTLELPDGRIIKEPANCNTQTFGVEHAGLRTIEVAEIGGPWTNILTEYSGRPIRLVKCLSPGGAIDVFPLTFATTGSLRRLEREVGETINPARLRAGLIIANEIEHEEDDWAEKNLAIGSVVIRVRTGVPRCQVVGFNPKEGKRDQDIMKALVKYRAKVNLPDGLLPDYATPGFATYAEVIKEGIITVGDKVEFVE